MSNTRASNWSVTINNPVPSDEEEIAIARQKGWKVEGQKEKGENGTEHYQLHVQTPQVRFSAVKKSFSRAHIEVARNPAALASYVTKEDTRIAALATTQEQYPSQSRIWEWFAQSCGSRSDFHAFIMDAYKAHTNLVAQDMAISLIDKRDFIDRHLLDRFDEVISTKISEGYYCELIGVNPQVRSAVKKYGFSILDRYWNAVARVETPVQTDRQTDTRLPVVEALAVDNTTPENADSQEDDWNF